MWAVRSAAPSSLRHSIAHTASTHTASECYVPTVNRHSLVHRLGRCSSNSCAHIVWWLLQRVRVRRGAQGSPCTRCDPGPAARLQRQEGKAAPLLRHASIAPRLYCGKPLLRQATPSHANRQSPTARGGVATILGDARADQPDDRHAADREGRAEGTAPSATASAGTEDFHPLPPPARAHTTHAPPLERLAQ